jgi:hypothetical protein
MPFPPLGDNLFWETGKGFRSVQSLSPPHMAASHARSLGVYRYPQISIRTRSGTASRFGLAGYLWNIEAFNRYLVETIVSESVYWRVIDGVATQGVREKTRTITYDPETGDIDDTTTQNDTGAGYTEGAAYGGQFPLSTGVFQDRTDEEENYYREVVVDGFAGDKTFTYEETRTMSSLYLADQEELQGFADEALGDPSPPTFGTNVTTNGYEVMVGAVDRGLKLDPKGRLIPMSTNGTWSATKFAYWIAAARPSGTSTFVGKTKVSWKVGKSLCKPYMISPESSEDVVEIFSVRDRYGVYNAKDAPDADTTPWRKAESSTETLYGIYPISNTSPDPLDDEEPSRISTTSVARSYPRGWSPFFGTQVFDFNSAVPCEYRVRAFRGMPSGGVVVRVWTKLTEIDIGEEFDEYGFPFMVDVETTISEEYQDVVLTGDEPIVSLGSKTLSLFPDSPKRSLLTLTIDPVWSKSEFDNDGEEAKTLNYTGSGPLFIDFERRGRVTQQFSGSGSVAPYGVVGVSLSGFSDENMNGYLRARRFIEQKLSLSDVDQSTEVIRSYDPEESKPLPETGSFVATKFENFGSGISPIIQTGTDFKIIDTPESGTALIGPFKVDFSGHGYETVFYDFKLEDVSDE